MSRDRLTGDAPSSVTTAVGVLVAVLCAVFGIGAHGLAAGMAPADLDTGPALLTMGVCAVVGAAVARLARTLPPLPLAGGGLLAGQLLTHLVLSAGHPDADPSGGHPAAHARHGASVHGPGGAAQSAIGALHLESLLTPTMLGAHLAAIGLTVALVALLIAVLDWGAARLPVAAARAPRVAVRPPGAHRTEVVADPRYLLSAGGTRAPPAAV